MRKEMILLGNLTCPSCAADLQKALRKLEGVKEATVNFAAGSLDVEYDEAALKAEDIDRTVGSFGVTVTSRL